MSIKNFPPLKYIRLNLSKKIENSIDYIHFLDQDWEDFVKKDTYCTYRVKHQFAISLAQYKKHKVLDFFYGSLLDEKGKLLLQERRKFIAKLEAKIEAFNNSFIGHRLKEYQALFDGKDDNLKTPLDEDQRRTVLTDDQHNLVVAGAGSGKTSVLTKRIAYLVRRKDAVSSKKILALAYGKDAQLEMEKRLTANFHISDVEIRTFHSFGFSILKENSKTIYDIQDSSKTIGELFPQIVSTDIHLQNLLISYLSDYIQKEPKETDFKTKKEYYEFLRNQQYMTLSGIEVKSLAERDIANFLFMHNIRYEYEKIARWGSTEKAYHPDFYLPDFNMYIEHWGVDKKGKVPPWFTKSSEEYMAQREWKLNAYKKHRKKLIETWDYERKEGTLTENLKENLVKANIIVIPLAHDELIQKVYRTHQDSFKEMKKLVTAVITHCKSNFMKPEDLKEHLEEGKFEVKSKVFGQIALIVYKKYQAYQKKNKTIDFEDMINLAITAIKDNPERYKNRYDHILIDEFQDISNQRIELIKMLVNDTTDTKLFCVGDDWQSIYKFAGSEVTFFVDFEKYFAKPAISYLSRNYRSTKSIVDVSTALIANNKKQRAKKVIAKNNVEQPLTLHIISKTVSPREYLTVQNKHISEEITKLLEQGVQPEEIMVLSRFKLSLSELGKVLIDSGNKKIGGKNLLTVHSSKGKEAKYVFIQNMNSGLYGFPSEIEDDSMLEIIKKQDKEDGIFDIEEERRLFYVALTRSKEYLYLYTHEGAESIFLEEIRDFIKKYSRVDSL